MLSHEGIVWPKSELSAGRDEGGDTYTSCYALIKPLKSLKVSTGRINPVKEPVVLLGVPGLLLGRDREFTSCRLEA